MFNMNVPYFNSDYEILQCYCNAIAMIIIAKKHRKND